MRIQQWRRIVKQAVVAHFSHPSSSSHITIAAQTQEALLHFANPNPSHDRLHRNPFSAAWLWQSCRSYAAPVSRTGKPPANGKQDKGGPEKLDRRINRAITARHVRLVSNEGHEILTRYEALTRAHHAGLDLVEVDGKSDPPVCKLMDFSKERFKDKRREKELRKKQVKRRRLDDLKEVRFSTRTEQKDLEMKAEIATRLLTRGHRVKVVVQSHAKDEVDKIGPDLLQRLMTMLPTVKVENGPRIEKTRVWILLRPTIVPDKTKLQKVDGNGSEESEDEDESDDEEIETVTDREEKSNDVPVIHAVGMGSVIGIG
ncbi:unnamed protein product [Sphagnum troendelagicum]